MQVGEFPAESFQDGHLEEWLLDFGLDADIKLVEETYCSLILRMDLELLD